MGCHLVQPRVRGRRGWLLLGREEAEQGQRVGRLIQKRKDNPAMT